MIQCENGATSVTARSCLLSEVLFSDSSGCLFSFTGGKPTILIVMHHTFNRDLVVGQSEKQVNDPNVCLTVDTLFYRGEFLQCHCNSTAWDQILTCLGLPTFEVMTSHLLTQSIEVPLRDLIMLFYSLSGLAREPP